MKTIRYEIQDGIATITFDEPNSPVNTMCLQWQEDMTELAAKVLQDKDAIKGIILASAKSTFFAGADLKGAMRLQPTDAGAIFTEIERVKKNFRAIETLGNFLQRSQHRPGGNRLILVEQRLNQAGCSKVSNTTIAVKPPPHSHQRAPVLRMSE